MSLRSTVQLVWQQDTDSQTSLMFASILLKYTQTQTRTQAHTQRHLGFQKTWFFFSILCGSQFHFSVSVCVVFLQRFGLFACFLSVFLASICLAYSFCFCINLCQLQASNTLFFNFFCCMPGVVSVVHSRKVFGLQTFSQNATSLVLNDVCLIVIVNYVLF